MTPDELFRPFHPNRIAAHLRAKAVAPVRAGHPWVFADSIERVSSAGEPGDVALLYAPGRRLLAAGILDPDSPVRVRVLQKTASEPPIGPELFDRLFRLAAERRAERIPPDTDGWRVIHGESDGFPGLVIDRYASVAVMKLYSAAFLPWAGTVAQALLRAIPNLTHLVVRRSRELDAHPLARRLFPDRAEVVSLSGKPLKNPVLFRENGIAFEADVLRGQKTGFFLDQRENRMAAGKLARGRDVLNVFSFSGGFSLYAARGGAKSVCSLDRDKYAIRACERHFQLNSDIPSVARCRHEGIAGDAFETMEALAGRGRRFDLVVVDPPSFAKAEAEKARALRSYGRLASLASALLRPRGILIFASCSSRISADEFFPAILRHARVREIRRTGHAPDHPDLFPESHYLKCLYAERLP